LPISPMFAPLLLGTMEGGGISGLPAAERPDGAAACLLSPEICLCRAVVVECTVDPARSDEDADRMCTRLAGATCADEVPAVGFKADVEDENCSGGSLPSLERVDCAEGGRLCGFDGIAIGFGLMSRYFFIVGVRGWVNLAS